MRRDVISRCPAPIVDRFQCVQGGSCFLGDGVEQLARGFPYLQLAAGSQWVDVTQLFALLDANEVGVVACLQVDPEHVAEP